MGWREALVGLTPRFLLRLFAGPYIAGNSLSKAMSKVDELWEQQELQSTLDLLGEGIKRPEDVVGEVEEYLRMIASIDDRSHVTISLKPTQLGLAFDPKLCYDNMCRILDQTEPKGIQVTIDMEESDYTEATLTLHRKLREKYRLVGTVLQARLFRTSGDIDKHLAGIRAHIRLCLGIYKEPSDIAYQKKAEMKENFFQLAQKLWAKGHFVGLATHDEALLRRCIDKAHELGIPQDQYEAQMLLGVPRDAIQAELREAGCPVRLYVPYGTTWNHAYAYAKRRLVENPNVGLYVARNVLRRIWEAIFPPRQLPPAKGKT